MFRTNLSSTSVAPLLARLRQSEILTASEEAVLSDLAKRSISAVRADRDLILEGDRPTSIKLILEGVACRYKLLSNGRRQIFAYLLPGDFCDLHVTILGQMDHGIRTMSNCVVSEIPGVTIENARMVLAPVEGNPAAVYFDFSYEGDRAFSLGRVSVEGAESAMMHQFGEYDFKVQMMEALPIPVTNGTKVEFKPGDYHVMAMGVSPDIKPGDTVEVTLTISGGDKHKFAAEVRAAGEER